MKKKNQSLNEIFSTAEENYKKKDFQTAEILCNKILNIDPNHFNSLFLLSTIFGIKNDFKRVKELLIKASKVQPNNVSVYNNLGVACQALNEFNYALSYYEKVISIDSNHTNANYNLGLVHKKLGDNKKAKIYLEKTVNVQPNFALAHYHLGNIQAEAKEYTKAKISYETTIKFRPSFPGSYNNLGLVFRLLGNYKEAINSYKNAIKADPNHAGAYNNLGRAYTELGKFDEAIDAHEKASKNEPNNLYHDFYLSELKKEYLNLKLTKKTEEILKKSKSKINLAFGNFLLSRFKQKEKNYKKEFEHLIKAHKHYFESQGQKFTLALKYNFDDVLKISNSIKVEKSSTKAASKVKPIFIIGVPRCGSTLIEKIIGSGKESILIGEEVSVIEDYINQKILKKKSMNLGESNILRDEIIQVYKNKGLINKENKYIFTDKTLNNFFYLDMIKKVFPEAKIINCKRNVLASIMSILQNNLTELAWAHDVENIFKYFDNYFKIINKFSKFFPNLIYDLEFEKFVNDPENESKKLMNFCDLPWDIKCLEYYKRKDMVSKTTSNQQIRKSIYISPIEKYLPYKQLLNEHGKKYSWFN